MINRLKTTAQTVGLLHRIVVSVALGVIAVVETRKYLKRELDNPDPARKRIR